MKEPGNPSSPILPKKVFFQGRPSKVISFGNTLNHKEFLNQTITKTGGKDKEEEEDEEEEGKEEMEEDRKNEKEDGAKKEGDFKLGWKQDEEQLKKNCLSPSCK